MSPEKLKRRALALGAELEIDGKTLNSGRQQLRVVPAKTVPPKPQPAPPPAQPAPDPIAGIKDVVVEQGRIAAEQGQRLAAVVAALVSAMQKPAPVGSTRPMPVAFDIKRDDRTGLMTRIVPVYASEVVH